MENNRSIGRPFLVKLLIVAGLFQVKLTLMDSSPSYLHRSYYLFSHGSLPYNLEESITVYPFIYLSIYLFIYRFRIFWQDRIRFIDFNDIRWNRRQERIWFDSIWLIRTFLSKRMNSVKRFFFYCRKIQSK